MGNRRKSAKERWARRRSKLREEMGSQAPPMLIKEEAVGTKVNVPSSQKVVLKTVPAIVHFGQLEGYIRDDSETIGEAVMYEDGTTDIIVFEGITQEARQVIYGMQSHIFSVMEGEANANPDNEA